MKHQWRKLGQLYKLSSIGRHPKLLTHAANPLPIHLSGDVYRIFYSSRDNQNRSSVGAVDIDILQRTIIVDHHHPFFEHGTDNSFFADGVSLGNCYKADGVRYILFMGWQNPTNKHWRGDIGRLILTRNNSLELDSLEPFMGSDSTDPLSLSYPWVRENKTDDFEMWYGSTQAWDAGNGEMLHVLKHAESQDGHIWVRNNLAIPYQIGVAQAFSRPTVVNGKNDELEMWFSYRSGSGEKYRIGHAKCESDGEWILNLLQSGIDVSDKGWDSEMIEYPFVFDHKGERYMLYNGNGYGKTGFGLAVLEKSR